MKSSAGTKQNASFKTKTKKSSFRNTRKTKWTRRAKERVKHKDKYDTSVMNPEWDENLHKITKLPNGKDNTSSSSVVLKKVGRKGNIAKPIVENENIGEIQGYEDINDPSKVTVFGCNLCQKMFTSSLGLNRHKQVHRAKDYACKICGKIFRRQSSLHKHSVLHSDDSPYKCPICGKYSKSKERSTLHLRTHSGVKPYQCDVCGRNFTQIGNLKLHKKNIHAPESVFKCEICCKEFEFNKELISHVLTHTDGKILKCYECGKMFGKKEHFEKHQELHTEVRPFSCDICGNTYKKNADLKCHLETHDTSQGYVCDVCGRSFGYKSSLKYHLRIHTGDKPYSCDICGKAFRTSSNRSKHVLSHTNYRPFSCDQCAKSFRDNRSLVIHKRTHSGSRPYQCSICFKSFIVQSELNRHRKKLHLNATECDNENGRTISTNGLSPYSKGTKYDQRELSVENTFDEMARDSVQNDVTKGRNHENLTHVEAASLGVDHMQLFPKESTTVRLPGVPIVNSSHASITTSLESNTVVEITNSCQYEMAVHYSSNNMYGYVRDMLLTGNEMGSRGSTSAPSPYLLPATSLCPANTSSTWNNNLESNDNSGVNSSQPTTLSHTNTTFFQRDRDSVMEPIMQLPNSMISAHYGRSNISEETIRCDTLSQCGIVNQTTKCDTLSQCGIVN
ncbi:zinc finger protein 83-like [Mizuhopecten yessoensis]|uniref:Zinc finger protein 2-like n=1 Tax=Mizuhopecten yessoensis TaxID=6573 RepID=A0A210QKT3_MIZYE|nr:zinc finger protein 83-like [Mizuhopecten yessoensis]OWF49316.1 Zinc finger protein 2-like [Mizuhopecten yessoensis]